MYGALWRSDTVTDLAVAGGILAIFLLAALLVRIVWTRVVESLAKGTHTELDDAVVQSLRGLIVWALILMGFYYSVSSLPVMESESKSQIVTLIGRMFGVAWVVLAVWTALSLFNDVVYWYVRRARNRSASISEVSHRAVLIRKAVDITVVGVGILYALRVAGVDITPLLASGAIGGLAVALAFQDTLANIFAGFFLNIDRPIKEGDFIKLSSGEEGYVEDIGWRNTKVRMLANNVVVVPNAKLSQSIITNYYLPREEMSVGVTCRVSYDSDLQVVEDITLEVAREVLHEVDGADTSWEPVVRWKEFGDSALVFSTSLRVKEFGAQYKLQSEFIKALHRRFKEEGVEIPCGERPVLVMQTAGDNGSDVNENGRVAA